MPVKHGQFPGRMSGAVTTGVVAILENGRTKIPGTLCPILLSAPYIREPGMTAWRCQWPRKVKRLRDSYTSVPMENRKINTSSRETVAYPTGSKKRVPKSPFGVIKGHHGIVVKTIMKGDPANIAMDPHCLAVIHDFAEEYGITPHIIVIDENTGDLFHKEGATDWRTRDMEKTTWAKIRKAIGP